MEIKKVYNQTPSKIRVLWETARKLIGDYENFDRRLSGMEQKITDITYKINQLFDRLTNVQ